MKVKAKTAKWQKVTSSSHAVFVTSDNWIGDLHEYNSFFKGDLIKFLKNINFDAKTGKTAVFYTNNKVLTPFIMIVGLGSKEKLDNTIIRRTAAIISKFAQNTHKKILSIDLQSGILGQKDPEHLSQIITEGIMLGSYKFKKYQKSNKSQTQLEEV